ncbi:hypothetical protein QBC36DRAFT_309649 [Triangularia setosa]|uniref:Uncharacterized protein n=1 Tax=Triangularia setosa TaxID=2587417 RepID=A0AAN7A9Z8_9PEZI|nr:hypothetical protein QBC36DRAFT_309649 [Podospora setosa]
MSRQPAFKWDVKLMVVLEYFNVTDMCRLKCGQFKCGEQQTPTRWMKDMKRLCLLHEVTDKKLFGHWIDDAFEFRCDKHQDRRFGKLSQDCGGHDELRDAVCWHVGPDKADIWAYNLVTILDFFKDEMYPLVKGETDEPNEFWSKRGAPALPELVKKVRGPVCHPDRKGFFRRGLREEERFHQALFGFMR